MHMGLLSYLPAEYNDVILGVEVMAGVGLFCAGRGLVA